MSAPQEAEHSERVVFDGSRFGAAGEVALSIIIPTLDHAAAIAPLMEDLAGLAVPHEVIVADGGSRDATCATAFELGARIVAARGGRGAQLAAGAAHARALLLCFLHPDVRVDARARMMIARLVRARPKGAYVFRVRIDDARVGCRLIEWGANARSRWARLPDGAHGLVVWRADYDRAGGYQALPLMEDVAFVRALARVTLVRVLPAALHLSRHHWHDERGSAEGAPVRAALREWMMLIAYLAGASPERLAARARAHHASDAHDAAAPGDG